MPTSSFLLIFKAGKPRIITSATPPHGSIRLLPGLFYPEVNQLFDVT